MIANFQTRTASLFLNRFSRGQRCRNRNVATYNEHPTFTSQFELLYLFSITY